MSVKKIKDEDLDYPDEILIYHVMPQDGFDIKNHFESDKCWCGPALQYKNPENGNEVWVHNLMQ